MKLNLKILFIITFFYFETVLCSGAFDHGSSVGKGRIQLDITLNPFNVFEFGQNYMVISYGIKKNLDIHAYFSNHANGTNQYYFGLMKQLIKKTRIDVSTAIGIRTPTNQDIIDLFFPQCLYTFKMNGFNIGGSIVAVENLNSNDFLGITYDATIFFPLEKIKKQFTYFEKIELGIGIFRNLGKHYYPTYSIDMKFKKFK